MDWRNALSTQQCTPTIQHRKMSHLCFYFCKFNSSPCLGLCLLSTLYTWQATYSQLGSNFIGFILFLLQIHFSWNFLVGSWCIFVTYVKHIKRILKGFYFWKKYACRIENLKCGANLTFKYIQYYKVTPIFTHESIIWGRKISLLCTWKISHVYVLWSSTKPCISQH